MKLKKGRKKDEQGREQPGQHKPEHGVQDRHDQHGQGQPRRDQQQDDRSGQGTMERGDDERGGRREEQIDNVPWVDKDKDGDARPAEHR